MTPKEREARLKVVGEKMKTAKGKELDALVKEVDEIIGFDSDKYDAEVDSAWEELHRE